MTVVTLVTGYSGNPVMTVWWLWLLCWHWWLCGDPEWLWWLWWPCGGCGDPVVTVVALVTLCWLVNLLWLCGHRFCLPLQSMWATPWLLEGQTEWPYPREHHPSALFYHIQIVIHLVKETYILPSNILSQLVFIHCYCTLQWTLTGKRVSLVGISLVNN